MQSVHINGMFDEHQKKFICQSCEKKYKTFLVIKKHLQKEHGLANLEDYVAYLSFIFHEVCSLLRDINNAYKMADGDRFLNTAKFKIRKSYKVSVMVIQIYGILFCFVVS